MVKAIILISAFIGSFFMFSQGCGHTGDSSVPSSAASDVNEANSAGHIQGITAARATIANNARCATVSDAYWEIGNAKGWIVRGTTKGGTIKAGTTVRLASATKWLVGAYALELTNGTLNSSQIKLLNFTSGYKDDNLIGCVFPLTVQGCFNANATYTAAEDGKYHYAMGHLQKLGVDLGIGNFTRAQLKADFEQKLGSFLNITWNNTILAGGASMTPRNYITFLQKLIRGDYQLSSRLGDNAVCTLPSQCATAIYSPSPYDTHYSYAHWVEDDPASDGAFSSPGRNGFYPWVSADKQFYGVVVQDADAGTAHLDSADCGRAVRKAFFTGVAQ